MKIGVIGCGSIGKRHISNLVQIDDVEVLAYDASKDATKAVKGKAKLFESHDALFNEKPDAIFICTPNNLHVEQAKLSLENNCHLFIEKPVSDRLEGLGELEKLASEKGKIVFVACNMRFHNSIKRLKSLIDSGKLGKILSVRAEFGHYLPNWRPGTDYTKTYSADKLQGGGILLDSIHEFDYLSWMLGEPSEIFCFADKLSDLKINVEDNAEILIKFLEGKTVEVHLDYLQRMKRRSCQIIGSEGTVIWMSTGKKPENSEVSFYDAKTNQWNKQTETIEINDAYVEEVNHFINCIKGKEKPVSDMASGIRALKMVMAAKTSAETGNVVKL